MARHALLDQPVLEQPPILPDNLGYYAVNGHDLTVSIVRENPTDGSPDIHRQVGKLEAMQTNDFTMQEIDRIRSRLQSLEGDQKQLVEEYVRQFYADEPYRAKHRSYVDWLADAPRGELLGFFKRHLTEIRTLQQAPEAQQGIADVKQRYIDAYLDGANDGWLSKNGLRHLSRIQNVRVLLGDIWDTLIGRSAQGYHYEGTDYVVLMQGTHEDTVLRVQEVLEQIRETLPHEFNHVILGHFLPRWLKEGLTEHVRLALTNGQPEILDPSDRADEGVYAPERKLLDTLLQAGCIKIDARHTTLAYSSSGYDSEEWKAFSAMLDEAWQQPNVLEKITNYIQLHEKRLRASHPDWSQQHIQNYALYEVRYELQRWGEQLRSRRGQVGGRAIGRAPVAHGVRMIPPSTTTYTSQSSLGQDI